MVSTLKVPALIVTLDGGKIKVNGGSGIYVLSSSVRIKSGEITIGSSGNGVYFYRSGSINMTGGKITASNATNSVTGVYCGTSSSTTASYTGGEIDLKSSGYVTGIQYCRNTMTNFKIKAVTTGSNTARGLSSPDASSITNSEITAIGPSSYGIRDSFNGTVNIKDGTTISGGTYGLYDVRAVINNSEITGGNSGISGGAITINSGTITGGTYGVNSGTVAVKGGEVSGGNYGIYNATNTIGTNDDEISITNPVIDGGMYGVYGGTTNFFDGVVKGAVAGFADESTIKQIPDGTITYTEEAEEKYNTWLVQGENYLEVDGVEYNSMTKAYEAITGNTGTIKVIASTTISAAMPTFIGKTITLDLNGKQLNLNQTLSNAGVLNIVDNSSEGTGKLANINGGTTISNTGSVNVKSGTLESTNRSIYSEGAGAIVTLDGGKIKVNGGSGIYVLSSSVRIKSGEITIGSSGNGVYFYRSGSINMTGGKITASNATNSVTGVYCDTSSSTTASYTGGEIDLKSSGYVTGIQYCRNTMSNFKIKAVTTGSNTARGLSSPDASTITNSEITAIGPSSYGIRDSFNGTVNIKDGTTISGGTYGLYSVTAVIGSNDGVIHADAPVIVGGLYAVYGSTNTKFYDGVLKGTTAGYAPNTISAMASNSIPVRETEDIDGVTYQVDYLVEEIDYIDNNGTAYKKLQTAIDEANNGDTLRFTASSANIDAVTIPEGKEITIDLAGQHLDTQRQITNRGKVTLKNSANNNDSYIRYPNSGYLITNYGELTVDNVDLKSTNIIENIAGGKLNLKDINLATSGVVMTNKGQVAFEGDVISGSVTMNSSATSTCTDSSFTGYLDNQSGTFSTERCSFVRPMDRTGQSVTSLTVINNAGTLNMSNSSIEAQIASGNSYISAAYGITNSGTFNMTNNSTITINDPSTYTSSGRFGIHNSGTATVTDTDITISSKDKTYGIYNASGTSVYGSGKIDSRSTNYAAHGIYVQSGEVSLGIPEDPSSPNYGRDTASVSTTNPDVFAKGTTGIGVKNAGGKFNFYDGKIMGNTGHMPETPTKVEYLYEPVEHIDDATDYKYVQLEWMREQP